MKTSAKKHFFQKRQASLVLSPAGLKLNVKPRFTQTEIFVTAYYIAL